MPATVMLTCIYCHNTRPMEEMDYVEYDTYQCKEVWCHIQCSTHPTNKMVPSQECQLCIEEYDNARTATYDKDLGGYRFI